MPLHSEQVASLVQTMKQYVLRRMKEDVEKGVPPKEVRHGFTRVCCNVTIDSYSILRSMCRIACALSIMCSD